MMEAGTNDLMAHFHKVAQFISMFRLTLLNHKMGE